MKILFKILVLAFFLSSCSKEPVETVFKEFDTSSGVFIACEGNFMYGNGSLSFYNDKKKIVNNRLFYAVNNVPPGDVVQSVELYGDNLFIVVNNSGKLYVVDARTIGFKAVITGLTSPRYIYFTDNGKAYISDLYAGHITVFDPVTFEKTGIIDLDGHKSEKMVQLGRFVYVTSWLFDSYILVIDTETDSLVAKIEVSYQPKDIVADSSGKLWVLSDGGFENSGEEPDKPSLSRIDPQTNTVEQLFRFEEGTWPSSLSINGAGDTLYYINGGVYKMGVVSPGLPQSPFILSNGAMFYSMAVNPANDEVYVADAIDFSQSGLIMRYTQSGELIDSFKAGVNPADFVFKK